MSNIKYGRCHGHELSRVLLVLLGLIVTYLSLGLLTAVINPGGHCNVFSNHIHMYSHAPPLCSLGGNQLVEISTVSELSIPIILAVMSVLVVKLYQKMTAVHMQSGVADE